MRDMRHKYSRNFYFKIGKEESDRLHLMARFGNKQEDLTGRIIRDKFLLKYFNKIERDEAIFLIPFMKYPRLTRQIKKHLELLGCPIETVEGYISKWTLEKIC